MATAHTPTKGPGGVAEPARIAESNDENELKASSVDLPTGPAPVHSRSDSANAPIAVEYDDGLEVYVNTDSKWLIPVTPESGGLEVHRDTSGLEVRTVEDDGLQRLKDDADLEVASVGSTPKDSPDHGSKSVWGGGGKKGRLSRKALWVSVVCVVVLAIIGTVVGTVVGIKASTNDGTSSDSESTESDFKDPFAQKMGLTTWVNGSHNFHIFYQGADGWIRHRVYDRDRYFREKADGWGPPSEAPKLALARPGSALSVAAAKLPGKPKQENQLPAVPSYEQPIAGKYEELEPAMAIYQFMLFYVNTDNILSNLVYHVKNDTWLPGNLAQLRREVAAHSGIASAYWPQTEPLGGGFDQWTVVTQLAATKKLEMLTGNLNIHTKTDATSLFEGGWPIPTRKDGTTGSFDGSDDVLPVDGTSIATILNRDPATNGFTSRIFYQRSDGMIQATVLNLTFWLTNEHIRNEYDAFNDLRPSVISVEEVGRAALRTPITVGLEAAMMPELHARDYLYSSSATHFVGGGYLSVLKQELLDFTWRWAESIQFWPYPNATVYALDAPNSITTFRLPFLEDLSQGMKGVWRDGGPFVKYDNVSALSIHGEDMIIGAGNATRLTWLSDYSIWADQGTVPL